MGSQNPKSGLRFQNSVSRSKIQNGQIWDFKIGVQNGSENDQKRSILVQKWSKMVVFGRKMVENGRFCSKKSLFWSKNGSQIQMKNGSKMANLKMTKIDPFWSNFDHFFSLILKKCQKRQKRQKTSFLPKPSKRPEDEKLLKSVRSELSHS